MPRLSWDRVPLLDLLTPRCFAAAGFLLAAGAAVFVLTPGGWLALDRAGQAFGVRYDADSDLDRETSAAVAPPREPWVWTEEDAAALVRHAYVGVTVWEVGRGSGLSTWTVAYSNPASSSILVRDMDDCIGMPPIDCFPELANAAGERYADLVRTVDRSQKTATVGLTRLTLATGESRYYYSSIVPLQPGYVALNYHTVYASTDSDGSTFSMGLDLGTDQAVAVQMQLMRQVLHDVETAMESDRDTSP